MLGTIVEIFSRSAPDSLPGVRFIKVGPLDNAKDIKVRNRERARERGRKRGLRSYAFTTVRVHGSSRCLRSCPVSSLSYLQLAAEIYVDTALPHVVQ